MYAWKMSLEMKITMIVDNNVWKNELPLLIVTLKSFDAKSTNTTTRIKVRIMNQLVNPNPNQVRI
jgi:hypothetical protein